jgi:hypothetical protein
LLDEAEHDVHVEVTVGPASPPQVPPELDPPLLDPELPPLDPPELLPLPPLAHAPLRGTHPLTCAPSTLLTVVHAWSAAQAPEAQVLTQ